MKLRGIDFGSVFAASGALNFFGGGGITIPIIGGGGILKKADVDLLYQCGADAVMIGSVAILRPWRVRGIIKRAKQIYGGGK